MSQYPPYYIKPVFNKAEQEALYKSGEASKIAHVPTRAALIDQTSSPFYDDKVALFTNYLMRNGDKQLARKLVEKTFEKIKRSQIARYHKADDADKEKILLDAKKIFHVAVENCKPIMHLTPIKRGGVRYQVPVPISDRRAQFLSMNWLIDAGCDKEAPMSFWDRLAIELIDASNNTGKVIKKKQDLHKQCEANRAYAHYRWS